MNLATFFPWLRRRAPAPAVVPRDVLPIPARDLPPHHVACRGYHANCPNCGMAGVCTIPHKGSSRITCLNCFRPFEPGA